MKKIFFFKNIHLLQAMILLGISIIFLATPQNIIFAKDDKDKTPPVITDLRVESITETGAVVMWTTDEPADSDIRYGIDPLLNRNGPFDPALVLSHAIALSELIPETTYAFCIRSKDAANNKATECGTFTTTASIPPPKGGGKYSGVVEIPTQVFVSGFAYPDAKLAVSLRSLPFGNTIENETTAEKDGSFSALFNDFPRGLYMFSVYAQDQNGVSSARKGFQFDLGGVDARIFKDKLLLPPTLALSRDTIAWGDNILASGSTTPNVSVLVEIGDVSYETKSDRSGAYEILINTARLTPGKVFVRARSSMISESGYDYSPSKIITISATTTPKADLNKDGKVDIKDLSIFLVKPVDMNGDKKIGPADFSIFIRALNQ